MAKSKIPKQTPKHLLVRLCRLHFVYIGIYALSVVIFDSWNLLAHEDVARRWSLVTALLIVNTVLWYLSRRQFKNQNVYTVLIITLLVADIVFAGLNVYWQRGMASKAVMLFAVPIIAAGLSRSRSLLLATTSLSTAAYSLAAVKYFYEYYGEGFRVELYGEVFLYSALFFVLAGLMLIGFRPAKD